MEIHPIAKIISEKGIGSVNLSMFTEPQRQEICAQASEILMRLNKWNEAIAAMEIAGLALPIDKIKKIADEKMLLGNYQEAYDLLVKAKQTEMAAFLKANFM